MSREIKFRVWSKTLGKYRQLDETSNDQGLGMLFEVKKGIGSNVTSICYSIGDVLEQFTGLKDSNGDDIYENDLVLLDPDDPPYQVIFDEGKFELSDDYLRLVYDLSEEHMDCEIIGNIHENPELVEADK